MPENYEFLDFRILEQPDPLPLRAFYASVILIAVKDALRKEVRLLKRMRVKQRKAAIARNNSIRREKEQVVEWLNGTISAVLPFADCCLALGYDEKRLRDAILEMMKGEKRPSDDSVSRKLQRAIGG